MGDRDSSPIEPMVVALDDPDESVRKEAVRALGEAADPQGTEPLIAALGDPVEEVRYLAAIALGKVGDARAARPLIAALQASSDYERRFSAAALGKIGDPEAIEPLSALLEDPVAIVRFAAEASLRQLGCDPQADAVERRKREVLSAAEGWWASKANGGEKVHVCDVCGRSIDEKRGTSLVGSYMRCVNCTERLFSRWSSEGMD